MERAQNSKLSAAERRGLIEAPKQRRHDLGSIPPLSAAERRGLIEAPSSDADKSTSLRLSAAERRGLIEAGLSRLFLDFPACAGIDR